MKQLFRRSWFFALLVSVWASTWAMADDDRQGKAIPYLDPLRPFYSERVPGPDVPVPDRPLRLATFNIHFSGDVPGVIGAFQTDPILKGADLIFLQEVTGKPGGPTNAARTIAEALGMNYVYTPAEIHPANHLDFGNAILSRWPLYEFRRVVLPHPRPGSGNRRVALGATVWIGDRELRLYSTHLETVFNDSIIPTEPDRADQVRTLLDAIRADGMDSVIAGGDFNSWDVFGMIKPKKLFAEDGFFYGNPGGYWTIRGPGGIPLFKLDHVFGRGIQGLASGRISALRVSDHVPVWMDFELN